MVAPTCFGITLPPSGSVPSASDRCSIEEQSIEYCAWQSQIATHHVTIHITPIHQVLSTAPQLGICQKALGKLPEDGNVMPERVGATVHN
jgi:hypothetical protein